MTETMENKLWTIIEPVIRLEGLSIVDLEYVPGRNKSVVRVFIDREETGVTLVDCERASKSIAAVLDAEDPVSERYDLEVSSPGINRSIRHTEDWTPFIGQNCKLRTRMPVSGRRNFLGKLEDVDVSKGTILIVLEKESFEIDRQNIDKANLNVELDRIPRSKNSKRGLRL